MPNLFICYRRRDAGAANYIAEHLRKTFRGEEVFLDTRSVQPGENYREAIRQAIYRSHLMLVIIGPEWLHSPDGGSRLLDENDDVRFEIETAIAQGLAVLPLLIDAAQMPRYPEVPPGITLICHIDAIKVDFHDLERGIDRLIHAIRAKGPDALPANARLGSAPCDVRQFVGRATELQRLRSFFLRPEPRGKLACLVGPGGVGKSALLSKFFLEVEQRELCVSGSSGPMGVYRIAYIEFRPDSEWFIGKLFNSCTAPDFVDTELMVIAR